MLKPSVPTCQCVVGYHTERQKDGTYRQVLDEGCDLPNIMEMCFGVCHKCKLPYFDPAELSGEHLSHVRIDEDGRMEPIYDSHV